MKPHAYDQGNFKFNKSNDLDLLKYSEQTFEHLERSLGFKIARSTIVIDSYQTKFENIKVPAPFVSPQEASKALLVGLMNTIKKVNDKLSIKSGIKEFAIDMKLFDVTQYKQLRTHDDGFRLHFPVEANSAVEIKKEFYDISINLDNPTSLLSGQQKGCQGTHFGYTIIKRSSGAKTRGHVLITTFLGYPSRDESTTMKPKRGKFLSFAKLCEAAQRSKDLTFDVTTDKGVGPVSCSFHNKRVNALPVELRNLHKPFEESKFIFPDISDEKLLFYLER